MDGVVERVTSRRMRRAARLIILAVALSVTARCTVDRDQPRSTVSGTPQREPAEATLTPVATATPILLEESACDSDEFDLHPDLDALPYEYFEPTRMRGALTVYGDGEKQIASLAGSDLTLRGVTFGPEAHGRIVEVEGLADPQGGNVFQVTRWRFAPAARALSAVVGKGWLGDAACGRYS
jgi:hypothetical protein